MEAAKSALAAAQEGLAGSQANQTQVKAMQEYSRIVAPFNGVVTWRYADTGSLIQAGTSNSNSLPVVKVAQVEHPSLSRYRCPNRYPAMCGLERTPTSVFKQPESNQR